MSQKYTPKTEEVRALYASARFDVWERQGTRAFRSEFNRWLAEHDAQVAKKAITKYEEGLAKFEEALRQAEEY